ncbi:MAG: heme-copper oxidase subunit III [Planctomycetota bacterium]
MTHSTGDPAATPGSADHLPADQAAPGVASAVPETATASAATATTVDPATADPSMHRLGMTIMIVSLSVLFAASLLVYWFLRLIIVKDWPPAGYQALPATIWLSTGLLALSSFTIELGRKRLRAGSAGSTDSTVRLAQMMLVSCLLGWMFLIAQIFNWTELIDSYLRAGIPMDRAHGIHAMMFILLTALHAAHVLGGVIPLTVIAVRSRRAAYAPPVHGTIEAMATYWHFLGIVWLVMFVTIFIPGG